nr:DUF374 domain-containing protein [Oceanococcus sp. HetDA_MAG_MS8]
MGRRLLYFVLLHIIQLLRRSCRYRIHGEQNLPADRAGLKGGFVMAFWHQNLVSAIMAESGRRCFTTMISRSRDGEAIAHVVRSLGHLPARGSSARGGRDKGGRQARDELVAYLQQGYPGAVTVDGPLGPLYEVKFGVIDMARKAGVPVVPYFVVPQRYWTVPSWDRLRIPWPFTTIDVYYGPPITVPEATQTRDFGPIQAQIKSALDAMEQQYNHTAVAQKP